MIYLRCKYDISACGRCECVLRTQRAKMTAYFSFFLTYDYIYCFIFIFVFYFI